MHYWQYLEDLMDKNVFTGILILIIVAVAFFVKPANARNEYLQYDSHCDGPTLEPYVEYSQSESTSTGSSTYGSNDDRGTIGLRLRIPLSSTCSSKYKKTMEENALLRQQLEMLKMCGRYKDLELGEEFAMVREKCKGVKRKAGTEDEEREIPETLLTPLKD